MLRVRGLAVTAVARGGTVTASPPPPGTRVLTSWSVPGSSAAGWQTPSSPRNDIRTGPSYCCTDRICLRHRICFVFLFLSLLLLEIVREEKGTSRSWLKIQATRTDTEWKENEEREKERKKNRGDDIQLSNSIALSLYSIFARRPPASPPPCLPAVSVFGIDPYFLFFFRF